jgi:kynurenine formamidase
MRRSSPFVGGGAARCHSKTAAWRTRSTPRRSTITPTDFQVHRVAGAQRARLRELTNLDQPLRGALVIALPMKIEGVRRTAARHRLRRGASLLQVRGTQSSAGF